MGDSFNVGSLYYDLGIRDLTDKELVAAGKRAEKTAASAKPLIVVAADPALADKEMAAAAVRAKKTADDAKPTIVVDADLKKAYDGLEAAKKAVEKADGQKAVVLITADGEQVTTELAVAERALADAQAKFDARKLKVQADTSQVKPELAKVDGLIDGMLAHGATPITPRVDVSAVDDDAGRGRSSLLDMISGWKTAALVTAAVVGGAIGDKLMGAFTDAIETRAGRDAGITASLGLSEEEAAVAGKLAGDLYANNFGESTGQVNESVREAMLLISQLPEGTFGSLEEASTAVNDLAANALNMSKVFGVDATRSIQVAGQMIRLGLAKDGTEAMDLLIGALQKVPAGLQGDALDAIDEYGKHFADLGISGPQAMDLLVKASAGGSIQIDKVGDALKELTIRGTDMSATSVQAYSAMGLSADDMAAKLLAGGDTAKGAFDQIVAGLLGMEDPTARGIAAVQLFGTPLEDLSTAQIPAFLKGLQGAGTGMDDFAGKASEFGTALNDNLASKIDGVIRMLSPTSLIDAFDQGGIDAVKERVQEGVDQLKAIWEEYGPAVKTMISEGLAALSKLWDEKGPAIIEALDEWWTETGGPAAKKIINKALGLAWDGVQAYFKDRVTDPGWWKDLVVNGMLGPFKEEMRSTVIEWAAIAAGWISSVPGMVAQKARGMWDGIGLAFETMLNGIIDMWNRLSFPSFTIPKVSIPGIGDIGGGTIGGWDLPNISHVSFGGSSGTVVGGQHNPPEFHKGGVVGGPKGKEVAALVLGGETVRTEKQERSLQQALSVTGYEPNKPGTLPGAINWGTGLSGDGVINWGGTAGMGGGLKWTGQATAAQNADYRAYALGMMPKLGGYRMNMPNRTTGLMGDAGVAAVAGKGGGRSGPLVHVETVNDGVTLESVFRQAAHLEGVAAP